MHPATNKNARPLHDLASIWTVLTSMEGDLGKKSIHTSDSFLHLNYFGIMVNEYSISIAYITNCTFCYMQIVM